MSLRAVRDGVGQTDEEVIDGDAELAALGVTGVSPDSLAMCVLACRATWSFLLKGLPHAGQV